MMDKVYIGTYYGGYTVPEGVIGKNSACLCFGAGEDISFEAGLAYKYGCRVIIFDPTPRAKEHFDNVVAAANSGMAFPINKSTSDFYFFTPGLTNLLSFDETGLWVRKITMKFYTPRNPEHVSHSCVNLQGTGSYFTAKVDRLKNILKKYGIKDPDLVKIDIEGAEYKVIDSIIDDGINIKVLCIEFNEAYMPIDNGWMKRVNESVNRLVVAGYSIFDVDENYNYTFLKI
jgi:hypothetical protein